MSSPATKVAVIWRPRPTTRYKLVMTLLVSYYLTCDRSDLTHSIEIFKHVEGGVEYRTVSWQRAAVIFTKVIFATGVLSIPSTMISLGAVGGGILVVCFGVINTYTALVLGRFRNAHAGCHTVADMARYVGGPILYEVVGILYLVAYVLCAGAGILGVSIGLNALSDHAACTVIWSFIATVVIIACASLPKFHQIGWLTWAVSHPFSADIARAHHLRASSPSLPPSSSWSSPSLCKTDRTPPPPASPTMATTPFPLLRRPLPRACSPAPTFLFPRRARAPSSPSYPR